MTNMNEVKRTPRAIDGGRSDLEAFAEATKGNAYLEDAHFRRLVGHYAWTERREALEQALTEFGAVVAGPLDELVRRNNAPENLPRLDRWTDYGRRQEKIEHHPTYHDAGRYIYGSGVMAAYGEHPNTMGALSRFYISSFHGEAGHNCPLACTAGVIRVLQELGTPEFQERYLPGLLNADYDQHLEGAQFLTEVQGGSDVGQNGSWAKKDEDGTWRVYGEKWFCSNIDADIFLMTARVDEFDGEGTRGLGLFLVPRELENGEVNEFYIRRLKDKLGTRSMASGEADFKGAVAYHMGPVGEGFKHMMELVINTSRLYNGIGDCGVMRRAYVTARAYAEHRRAFGHQIKDYPLVQETLANMRSEQETMLSGNFYLVAMQDRIDDGQATEEEQGFFRMALNLNKTRMARAGRWACVEGIEILGGNGAIETFSVLPRLLRDAIVYENWEGTHNTLYMQILRDMKRYEVHKAFFGHLDGLVEVAKQSQEAERADVVARRLGELRQEVEALLEKPLPVASLAMRRVVDPLADAFYAAVRVWERAFFGAPDSLADEDSLEQYLDRHLRQREIDIDDPAYLERLQRLL